MKVNVVDAICGAGKSTSLINMINETNDNNVKYAQYQGGEITYV